MDALESFRLESVLAAEAEKKAEDDDVGQTDFLKMLVAQLENQDPLNPQDSAQFAAQLAQFSSVEQLIAVRAGIDELVANSGSGSQADPSDPVSGLDPAALVGRDVVVFGSQIEVDGERTPIELPIRNIDTAITARVAIYDEDGRLRHTRSILPTDANNDEVALRSGDHTFRFDPAEHNLPEGVYAIEFEATGPDGDPITILPMVEGTVTGAIVAGTPSVRIGGRIFPVADILEVKLREDQQRATAGQRFATGGGQNVVRDEALAASRAIAWPAQ